MSRITKRRIAQFQKKILSFYAEKKRDLPWRRTTDPYAILLSEIMLQQTQVDRVVAYYKRWLEKWPTIRDLAGASRAEVFREWLGLGYNNRAKNLHEAAKIISEKYKGNVLAALEHYGELPGIGPYTAAAVHIFSANKGLITVDTNIRRILIHEFRLDEKIADRELREIAGKCLPPGKSRDWHNALMDYGAMFLTSRKTGIRPKTRQLQFEGSDRQVRSRILRHLLNGKDCSLGELRKIAGCDAKQLRRIVEGMAKDGIIGQRNGNYRVEG